LQRAAGMANNSSIFLCSCVVAWTVAGQTGCMPDATVRASDVDACPAQQYRVSSIEIPTSGFAAIELAFDLDGDGVRDNWLGLANALVHAWSSAFDLSAHVDARLAGGLDWRLTIHQCDAGRAASAGLGAGGEEAIETARGDRAPGAAPLIGGTFAIPLGALSDALGTADEAWVAAPLAQVRLEAFDAGGASAVVGLAIGADDLAAIVAPNLAAYFTARLAEEDSDFAAEADTDGDGVVTPDELLASDTARVLLAPDLDPELDLPGGGASLGFRIRAEHSP
jgi:hypothetical protein